MDGPQRLDDVKSGDTVTVFPVGSAPRQSRVNRVTKHLIILDGGDHYSRHWGTLSDSDYSRSFNRSFIAVGEKAEEATIERAANILRAEAAHRLGVPKERLNQQTVTVHRKACDTAEAALRKLGEWS
jgi:hypothetical protein